MFEKVQGMTMLLSLFPPILFPGFSNPEPNQIWKSNKQRSSTAGMIIFFFAFDLLTEFLSFFFFINRISMVKLSLCSWDGHNFIISHYFYTSNIIFRILATISMNRIYQCSIIFLCCTQVLALTLEDLKFSLSMCDLKLFTSLTYCLQV